MIPIYLNPDDDKSLPTVYQQVIHRSRYARWRDEFQRRESWLETVYRYCDFFHKHLLTNFGYDAGHPFDKNTILGKVFDAIYNLHVMPSMRCLMTAGPALEREHMCGFNCAYRAIDDYRVFAEIMYILMCGTGVGFSVERQYIAHLPLIPRRLKPSDEVIVVEDSREGWATAFYTLLTRLYEGKIPQWNVDLIRPLGSRLKTMGGFASGPGPLVELFKFTIDVFKKATGRRLNSLECHDIACKIGDVVVMGGVRRSALISLSNLSDHRMRSAKSGNWYTTARWRELANNSVMYTERPTVSSFMTEWHALYESKSGERGMVNREALTAKAAQIGRRTHWDDMATDAEDLIEFGVNPCAEIILRSAQTCNLSEIIARPTDTIDFLVRKAALAAVLGTWQSTLTNFNFIGPEWKQNCEEERLLGVSITGIMDCPILSARNSEAFITALEDMRAAVRKINASWAEKLGINGSAAITCVKPSGTVSQLVNSSSGIHSRYAPFYIRRIAMNNEDPICQFLIDQGIPHEEHVSKPKAMTVFEFPVRSPAGANATTKERTAIDQLEHWKAVNEAWADHSVSCTIEVEEHEWPEVGGWVYNNFDKISGISFLPKSGAVYQQAPYEPITEEQCAALEKRMPTYIDWNRLSLYEQVDNTTVGHEFACTGNSCEYTGAL